VSRIWDWEETAIVELESSGIPCIERSTARWYTDRSSKRHSKKKKHEEDV